MCFLPNAAKIRIRKRERTKTLRTTEWATRLFVAASHHILKAAAKSRLKIGENCGPTFNICAGQVGVQMEIKSTGTPILKEALNQFQ